MDDIFGQLEKSKRFLERHFGTPPPKPKENCQGCHAPTDIVIAMDKEVLFVCVNCTQTVLLDRKVPTKLHEKIHESSSTRVT